MHKFPWPALVVLVLAACAAPQRGLPPPTPSPPAAPPPVVEAPPPAQPAPGQEAWNVVASQLAIRVYRDGPMQKLGHDHIITSDALTGRIALGEPLSATSFELSLPLESLVVDDEASRQSAGGIFAAPVPQKDREATRTNMLGPKVLTGGADRFEARVRVSLAGHESVVSAPFSVTVEGDHLKAQADLRLTHADLGLQPFTVALGALRVREDFEVALTLEARRGS